MFHWLSNLFMGLKRLAQNVHALADTLGDVNTVVRERLELPMPHIPDVPALPAPVVGRDDARPGPLQPEQIDHNANGFLPPPPPEEKRKKAPKATPKP